MDEFTGIAIWVLAIFLAVNVTAVWWDSSVDVQANGLGLGVNNNPAFDMNDLLASYTNIFGVNCSTISANDVINGSICGIGQIWDSMTKITQTLWGLATGWTNLLTIIFTPFGSIGALFNLLLTIFFGIIEFVAIFIILMRVVGVIRGGS